MTSNPIVLSTGKVIDAFRSIIGINDSGDVYEGYDGTIFNPTYNEATDSEPELSPIERIELADVMIARWGKFKSAATEDLAKGDLAS